MLLKNLLVLAGAITASSFPFSPSCLEMIVPSAFTSKVTHEEQKALPSGGEMLTLPYSFTLWTKREWGTYPIGLTSSQPFAYDTLQFMSASASPTVFTLVNGSFGPKATDNSGKKLYFVKADIGISIVRLQTEPHEMSQFSVTSKPWGNSLDFASFRTYLIEMCDRWFDY